MKNKYAVSVLVPIYNVEIYIEQCVRSLFEQTLTDIEYIFIDDCTPDHSIDVLMSVISEYPDREQSVTIIRHTTNLGIGVSRNDAVGIAKGDYLFFVDSDDFIEDNAIELFYTKAVVEQADIVVADFWLYYNNKRKYLFLYSLEIVPSMFFRQLLEKKIPAYLCNKLIRSGLYQSYNINIPEGINFMEDFATLPRLVFYAEKIVRVQLPLYYYRQNLNSYCNSLSQPSIISAFKSIEAIDSFLKVQVKSSEYKYSLDLCKQQTKLMLVYAAPQHAKLICSYYPSLNEPAVLKNFNYRERVLLNFIYNKSYLKITYLVNFMKMASRLRLMIRSIFTSCFMLFDVFKK